MPSPRSVLVYSSSATTREKVRTALGRRPAPDLEIEIVEAATGDEVIARCDEGGIDVAVLDGEAAPTGGIGLARQLKDELDFAPPVLLILGRRDDAWLATWSRAESVVMHPIDALRLTDAVVALLATTDHAGDVAGEAPVDLHDTQPGAQPAEARPDTHAAGDSDTSAAGAANAPAGTTPAGVGAEAGTASPGVAAEH
jgi:DNA-binding LytR/AlgR family response regulator